MKFILVHSAFGTRQTKRVFGYNSCSNRCASYRSVVQYFGKVHEYDITIVYCHLLR